MQESWLCQMADRLTCEIIKQMSGIHLSRQMSQEADQVVMDAVYGFVDGEYHMCLQFCAEPRLFSRLARNMIGDEPEDDEEVREYATEFFNVLCGRFISEIHRKTQVAARFNPTLYKAHPHVSWLEGKEPISTLYFESEEQELARFSWSQKSVDRLLKRSEMQ